MDGYGMGGAGWLMMATAWVALVVIVVFAVTRIFPRHDGHDPTLGASSVAPERPLAILDRRLASGEIDVETYDRLRERLLDTGSGR
jgi:putative membrane protein